MKKIFAGIIVFIGWLLSPFTWWNDPFINIPLSYLIASLIFYVMPLSFKWLLISSYWFTNVVGLIFMYFGGEKFIFSSGKKIKAMVFLVIMLIIYTAIMIQADKFWNLRPISEYFKKYSVIR